MFKLYKTSLSTVGGKNLDLTNPRYNKRISYVLGFKKGLALVKAEKSYQFKKHR